MCKIDFSWSALEALGAFVTAVCATGAVWQASLWEEKKREFEMSKEYDLLTSHRKVFWEYLKRARRRHTDTTDSSKIIEDLAEFVIAIGHPPNTQGDLVEWPKNHAQSLSGKSLQMWEFVVAIYPSSKGKSEPVTDHSLIPGPDAERFDEARRVLAKFWNSWSPHVRDSFIRRRFRSARPQLIALEWLEIALTQWTRDPGRKDGLFDAGELF